MMKRHKYQAASCQTAVICCSTSGRRRRGAEATKGNPYFWKRLVGLGTGFSSHEALGLRPSTISGMWGWPTARIKGLNFIWFKSEAELSWHLLSWDSRKSKQASLTGTKLSLQIHLSHLPTTKWEPNWWCLRLTSTPSYLLCFGTWGEGRHRGEKDVWQIEIQLA